MDQWGAKPRIHTELIKAKEKYPQWFTDPVHAVNILAEEVGELQQAVNDFCYHEGDREKMILEACQAGAMVIRFLTGIYQYQRVQAYDGK